MRALNHHEPPVKTGPGGDYVEGYVPTRWGIEWKFALAAATVAAASLTTGLFFPIYAIGMAVGLITGLLLGSIKP